MFKDKRYYINKVNEFCGLVMTAFAFALFVLFIFIMA